VEGGPADISFKADAAFHEMPRYLLTRPDAPAIFASLKKPGSGGRDGMKGLATESGRGDIRPERNRIADRDSVSGISDESRDGEGDRSSSMKVDYRAQLSGVIMTAGFKTPVALGGHGVKDGALSGKTRLAALSGFHGDIKVRISGLMDLFRHTCLRFADSIQKKISLCRGRIENWLKSPGSVKNRGSRV
jgi:hypothetical protein